MSIYQSGNIPYVFHPPLERHKVRSALIEMGLNGDNSPKQAAGTMRKNFQTEVSLLENNLALFVDSKPYANFVLWISFTLFTHTRTTLRSRDITSQNCSEEKSVSTGTTVRSKQPERCERTAERKSRCLKTTLCFLCTQPQIQRLLVDLTVKFWGSVGDSGFLSQLPSSKASETAPAFPKLEPSPADSSKHCSLC